MPFWPVGDTGARPALSWVYTGRTRCSRFFEAVRENLLQRLNYGIGESRVSIIGATPSDRRASMRLSDWFLGRKSLPPSRSPPSVSPTLGVPAADLRRAADWFTGEAPAWGVLGQASLAALVQASPQPVDPAPNHDPLAWLPAAWRRLDALSEQVEALSRQPPAHAVPWRYLIFIRVLCDTLETTHQAAFLRGLPMRCPLTRILDPHPPSRGWRPASPGVQAIYSGLGTLLAGAWLPKAGQQGLFLATAQGIDWMDSAAFWAQVNAIGTTPPPPASLPEAAPVAAAEPRAAAPTRAAPARKRAATTAPPSSLPDADAPGARPSHPTALSDAVRQVLQDLIRHPLFNRQPGPGWRTEDAYWVAARRVAERLMEQPGVQAQAFPERRVIYHRMGCQGLLLPHGSQAIWSIFVTDPGEAQARLVPALKLPIGLLEKPQGSLYQGRLQLENPWDPE